MKGDLHTLKKVCFYGSKTMFCGSIVLMILAVALTLIGGLSLFSEDMGGILDDILSTGDGVGPIVRCSSFFELLFLLLLAAVSVYVTFVVMRSVSNEHSPFNESNTKHAIRLSQIYLVSAFLFASLEIAGNKEVASVLFMFFGCILVSVILYVLALIIRYGAVLQTESDHTL